MEQVKLSKLAQGAVEEAFGVALQKAIENILDPNTEETKSRKITLTVDLKPQKGRRLVNTTINTKLSLAGDEPIVTNLQLSSKGESAEWKQENMFEEEATEQPKGDNVTEFRRGEAQT